jgi:Ca2+-transporting ATPase
MNQREWYRENVADIMKFFNSGARGLTDNAVSENRSKYGQNTLNVESKRGVLSIIVNQLNSPLVYILILSSILVMILGDYVDAAIIFIIVVVNTIVGAIQEGRAENTLDALKKVIKSYANVIRNGEEVTIEDTELVPGDIVILKDGSLVPADARIIESNELKVNQSALTGESEPVVKEVGNIAATNLGFNEQKNMVFRGTYIISGLAKAVVVRTGPKTLIGQISDKLTKIDSEIPLKKKIRKISNLLLGVVGIISLLVFAVGIYRGHDFLEMLITVVAISVSAIPESLPLIVTLVLASGVWRMSQKKVLVKRLQAVEALGQAKIIAVDKTGTLTKNQMTVGEMYVNNRYIKVSGEGYNNQGGFSEKNGVIVVNKDENCYLDDPDVDLMTKISTFTAIADFDRSEQNNWRLEMGDPTEAALKVLGEKAGFTKTELENRFPKILEIPFSLKTKFHATINQIDNKKMMSVAGSPEVLLEMCDTVWDNGRRKKLTVTERNKLEAVINQFSGEGYRVLALAANFNPPKSSSSNNMPKLTFVGFVGIIDAIRHEVFESVAQAKKANMKVVMITGDHVKTAEAIAKKVGIFHKGDLVMSGHQIDQLDDEAFSHIIGKVSVFARVSPDNKLRIIEAFKSRGDIVAMTGDGINDALSLVAADLGVAMGQNGTEVAREAADLVLTDDNFGNIIHAAEEGRNIYWIIRKAILYLLSTNTGELLVITLAIFAGLPLPLLATQILWINLVTDSFLAASLAMEPKEDNLMDEIYRREGGKLIDRMMITRILIISSLMTFATLYLFIGSLDGPMEKAWTISMTTLTVFQWFNIFSIKSHHKTIFSWKTFNNKYLIGGLVMAASMHLFAVYHPFMQKVLHTAALSWSEWRIILILAFLAIMVEEGRKVFYKKIFNKAVF